MLVSEIKPFIRYARFLSVTKSHNYPIYYPCDARLFFVYSGTGIIETNDKIYKLPRNSILMINADTPYRILSADVTYLAVNFDYTQNHIDKTIPVFPMTTEDYNKNNIIEKCNFEDFPELDSFHFITDMSTSCEKLEKLLREFTLKIIYNELKTGAIMCEIITDIIRKSRAVVTANNIYPADRIINFIHENFRADITNKVLGEKFGLHPNYISTIIKRQTGLPLHKYLLNVRISHAVNLLDEGSGTISEIAEKCGFCDVYYFSAYFKKVMGASPSEYRKGMSLKTYPHNIT